jgi:hypothetical protein
VNLPVTLAGLIRRCRLKARSHLQDHNSPIHLRNIWVRELPAKYPDLR